MVTFSTSVKLAMSDLLTRSLASHESSSSSLMAFAPTSSAKLLPAPEPVFQLGGSDAICAMATTQRIGLIV